MSTMMITGGSGFLGSLLVGHFHRLCNLSYTVAQHPVEIPGARAVPLDLCERQSVSRVLEEVAPSVVIHCAAIAHAGQCQQDPDRARQVNRDGTANLLQALPPETLFIHLSTDLVFDGEHAPYSDDAPRNPLSVYGQSKRDAEDLVLAAPGQAVVLRPALIYGPVSPAGKGSFLQWMLNGLRSGEPLKVFVDEFRTPVFALDIARAIEWLMENRGGQHRCYNIGGGQRINRVDFARQVCGAYGLSESCIVPVHLSDVDTGYPRARDVSLRNDRLKAGRFSPTPIAEAIARIVHEKGGH